MQAATTKPKPVNENDIQLSMWFKDDATLRAFAAQNFAERSVLAGTVTDRAWVSVTPSEYEGDPSLDAVYRFKHTCKNRGAHESDTQRFFDRTRRNAYIAENDAVVTEVKLLGKRIIEST